MTPYDILSAFDALSVNEMPPMSDEDELAEIDRILDTACEDIPVIELEEVKAA